MEDITVKLKKLAKTAKQIHAAQQSNSPFPLPPAVFQLSNSFVNDLGDLGSALGEDEFCKKAYYHFFNLKIETNTSQPLISLN